VAFFRVASIAPRSASHVLVVAPRFLTPLVEPGQPPLGRQVWEDTAIALPDDAPRAWHHAITEETLEAQGSLPVGDILAQFPVAILVAKAPNST